MDDSLTSDAEAAIQLATTLLVRAAALQTPAERRQQSELDRMIGHDADKATLVEMTDQAFRTHTPARVADQLTHLLDVQGVPRFFSPVEQAMLKGFQAFGEYLPGVAVPLVKEKMRRETANVILPAEQQWLREHLTDRNRHGVQMNVNLLGEAILGEAEAMRRMQRVLELLKMPEVQCVSVKISTLYSQVSPLAFQYTVNVVADRLENLYRTASQEIHAASGKNKFVYLDMEEYRDLHLTTETLMEALSREGLDDCHAGIALQAYIPDSFGVMKRLIDWSTHRVQNGGRPLTIRLVKGANMEMERVEAAIAGFDQAPYHTKIETDANYKRMLRHLLDAAADGFIRVGVASHNLFDVALAMIWTEQRGASDHVQFEMLEGMANHQRRAISEHDVPMLLYAPACQRKDFINAIGYLIRRLDENTGAQNFLRHAYRLKPDTPEFKSLAGGFRESLEQSEKPTLDSQRNQDRFATPIQPPKVAVVPEFVNEPDTDWALPRHSLWAQQIIDRWLPRCDANATEIPLLIGGETAMGKRSESTDPSRPGVMVAHYEQASADQARQAVQMAKTDRSGWRAMTADQRRELLRTTAQNLRVRRADLIGAMIADGGKTIMEADPEVSEAIDFCEFYSLSAEQYYSPQWQEFHQLSVRPRGVVAVISPWNFPLAIPCGGIASALSAGNTVILKPSGNTVLVAWLLCQAFWDAGVPHDSLQLITCSGATAEEALVRNPDVDSVILTGSTQTARRMMSVRPDLHLLAETGGKNATIVSAMADRDLAIKHVVHSAFGHSGQKCSATSLLLLQDEVFHDETFRETLADAVRSITVGSAWDLHTKMGPLISPPSEVLTRGMKTLQDAESWLVMPEHVVNNPCLYRPGVKWNIREGGFMHRTELFGPVLGVMRYSRLEHAIEIVRGTGYGLTSGLESLDDREIELWRQSIHAGNLYINRPTTGAIVLRQPFGGVGLSAYGPGVKAGGPHYVLPLMRVQDAVAPQPYHEGGDESLDRPIAAWAKATIDQCDDPGIESPQLAHALESQRAAVEQEYSRQHDTFRLLGQDNLRRYRPASGLTIRFTPDDSLRDVLLALTAAVTAGTPTTLSIDPAVAYELREILESSADHEPGMIHPLEESADELVERITAGDVHRLRLLHATDSRSAESIAAAATLTTIMDAPVVAAGQIECLRYLSEQSISYDYHRYGNLGRRAAEQRTQPSANLQNA
ncbi:bifunctional proline dehydrogenase/L-glutamate gamma-semialdehyde dehydrogenase [Stieleria varia]|uniref:L-glutamate gamma-semialdehyde dehydrogenase n=1 Tax=Stieleria varia TaxID=2528005 RepID=A0A5C6ANH8_9BACT|nr:bifunctional proline dehydrogenase/L-glutamate gamma-semialdehyde dehydrogenase [Stieleria varia]TWU01230.1 Bifunctional protein PutA [Stieleria varia]